MASVAITLKLTASEFQTLRTELSAHRQALHSARYDEHGQRKPESPELIKREAQVANLLEKLG